MAEAKSTLQSYFYMILNVWVGDTDSYSYHRLDWSLTIHHSRLSVGGGSATVWINGQQKDLSFGSRNTGKGSYDWVVGSGSEYIYHTNAVDVGFSFTMNSRWNIGGKSTYGMSASNSIHLGGFAVSPTLPNSVSVSGGNGGWLPLSNPVCNVSWSGASSGTYYIDMYSIDASRDNWASAPNVGGTVSVANATSGSKNNVNLSMSGLRGGDTVRVRVGMRTNNGTWWGHSYWGGSFKIYTSPTAPTTFSVPSSQEIDTAFNITWAGASAGSNGIAGYDLEIRAYNGSSWTDWVRLWNCVNKTSYSSGSPKSLSVNGVSYANNGENVQFQYRLRTSDGIIATSDWVVKTMKIFINSPTAPRK